MKLFIPTVGTKLVVTEPWQLWLHDEYRNVDFWTDFTGNPPPRQKDSTGYWSKHASSGKPIEITLPVGTILQVDRIYIRKGNGDFDSVSFRVLKGGPTPPGRFWAKLNDVNNLNVVYYEDPINTRR